MRDAGVKIGCIPFVLKKFLNMVARGNFYNEWLRGIYGEVIWFSIFEIKALENPVWEVNISWVKCFSKRNCRIIFAIIL
jgi:hypothetical protein